MRTRRLSQLLAALSVVAVGAAVPEAPAAGTTTCRYPDRHVFAVAADGKLHELARCVYAPGQHRPATNRRIIEDLGVVDGGDWRAQRWVTAAVDGAVTTVWTVEADGRLVRRVQSAPGTPLGPPEVVEVGRDDAGGQQVPVVGVDRADLSLVGAQGHGVAVLVGHPVGGVEPAAQRGGAGEEAAGERSVPGGGEGDGAVAEGGVVVGLQLAGRDRVVDHAATFVDECLRPARNVSTA